MGKRFWIAVALLALAAGRLTSDAEAEGGERGRAPHGEEGEERRGPEAARGPSEAEEREALDFIRDNNPEMAKHLGEAKDHNPEMFRHKLREIVEMHRNPDMRRMFALNMKSEGKVRRLSDAYRKAEGKEKEALRGELEQALGEQFDAKLSGHELKIKKMQEEIARQKERIAKRKALKEQIVKKRLAEISGDVESWDW